MGKADKKTLMEILKNRFLRGYIQESQITGSGGSPKTNTGKKITNLMATCISCGEATDHPRRGRCNCCYREALKCIKEGYTSWKFLEDFGLALPLKRKNKGGNKIGGIKYNEN